MSEGLNLLRESITMHWAAILRSDQEAIPLTQNPGRHPGPGAAPENGRKPAVRRVGSLSIGVGGVDMADGASI